MSTQAARSLVVFGEDWGRHPSSTQHMVSRLAHDRDVIWVNSIGMRRPRFTTRDLGRVGRKLITMAGMGSVSQPLPERSGLKPPRLSILAPQAVSWPGNAMAGVFNRASLGRQIRHEIRRRNLDAPILWTSLPTALPVIGSIGEHGVVYYCGDDFSALDGVDHEPVAAMEQGLVARADMIIACSEVLAAQFPAGKTTLVPHGVDIALFQREAPRPADMPAADMPAGSRIAGFYGSLSSWIDLEAIAQTARSLPDWTFLLIGPVRCNIDAIAGIGNIRLLGEKPHHNLPAYVQHWTVSLLPFRDTPQIRACNPLKLREYLAVGKPIVTPLYPAMTAFADMLQLYDFGTDFSAAILAAAADTARNGERRQRVATESWDARAARVSALLDGLGP